MPQLAPVAVEALFVAAFMAAEVAVVAAIAHATAPDAEAPFQPSVLGERDISAGLRANTRSTNAPLPVVYGKVRIGGNIVFMEAAGTDNKDLWVVQNLAEGECEGIAQVDGVDQVWLGDKLYNEYGGNVSYTFHSGSSSQTYDSNLNSAIAKWIDNQRYTCYMVYKLSFDKDYFQSLPNLTVLLKGRKLYDFRDGTTAWSDNPVLALYDYMTSARYGRGYANSRFDIPTWTSAANYCDTKGWTINMGINRPSAVEDVQDSIRALFRGRRNWWDGKIYLRYADLNYESSVMNLGDEHIAQDSNGKAAIKIVQPGKFDAPDAVRVRFVDAEKDYIEDSVVIGDALGIVREVKLEGCTDREHASNIGVYLLERMQLDRSITLTGRDDALKLEPHDVVTLTTSALDINNQTMRVTAANIRATGQIDLTLAYEAAALYNDDYDLDIEGTYTCTLPDPNDEPPSVGNVAVAEETYYYRLRNFTRLKVTFDEPANYAWFDYVEVWTSYDDSTWEHQFNTTDDFELANVEEGQGYYIRLVVVSTHGVKQQTTNAAKTHHVVVGYTDAPTSLPSLDAVVNQNAVNLYSTKLDDPDIEVYEFRLGSSWSGGIFLAALRAPNLSLFGVKPGSHTFWVNTLSTNGEYGNTPQSASVSVIDPPDGWTVQNTETCGYAEAGETHSNTEQVTYDAEDYLKCSHTAGVLVGTYTSPIYDRGASGRYLIYVLADIAVTGLGTTWDDVIPGSTTWADISIATKTWAEIFELLAGPSVSMKLKYGATSPPTSEVGRMEILSAIVTARYFQVEIEITDPIDAVNALVQNFSLKFCQ